MGRHGAGEADISGHARGARRNRLKETPPIHHSYLQCEIGEQPGAFGRGHEERNFGKEFLTESQVKESKLDSQHWKARQIACQERTMIVY